MIRYGKTKFAVATLEEMKRLLTDPVEKRENEISFNEFMNAYNPKNEEHNFTYPIPDKKGFLNLQIYNVLMNPYVVLKLDHPLLYRDGLQFELCFDSTSRGYSIQCANEYLKEEIYKLQREIMKDSLYNRFAPKAQEEFMKMLGERELFRKEYFPKVIIEKVERQKSLGKKNFR